jgi:NADPH:quinone reductase-like Zn-dependent oxidoreductase
MIHPAALISLPAMAAASSKSNLISGQSTLNAGCLGGVGRLAVQISRKHGASISESCAASDRDEAHVLGEYEIINYRGPDISRYKARFDVIFDTAGVLAESVRHDAQTTREIAAHRSDAGEDPGLRDSVARSPCIW